MQSEETGSQTPFSQSSFEVDVNEAVQLLGVSRTRLSQLVSKGVLGFERRRVETRLRMYFNRTELLSYLRRQMSGASAKVKQNEWIFDAEPLPQAMALPYSNLENDVAESATTRAFTSFRKHNASPNLARGSQPLKASAYAIKQKLVADSQQAHKQSCLHQQIKEQSRELEKKLYQLQSAKGPIKSFVSAVKIKEDEKKKEPAYKARSFVRTLSRRLASRVQVK